MSDFVRCLAERSLRRASGVRPRILPLFASSEPPIEHEWEVVIRQDRRESASAVQTREPEFSRLADFKKQEEEFAKVPEAFDESAEPVSFRSEDDSPKRSVSDLPLAEEGRIIVVSGSRAVRA